MGRKNPGTHPKDGEVSRGRCDVSSVQWKPGLSLSAEEAIRLWDEIEEMYDRHDKRDTLALKKSREQWDAFEELRQGEGKT